MTEEQQFHIRMIVHIVCVCVVFGGALLFMLLVFLNHAADRDSTRRRREAMKFKEPGEWQKQRK